MKTMIRKAHAAITRAYILILAAGFASAALADTNMSVPAPTVFTVTSIDAVAQTNFNGSAVTIAYSDMQLGDYQQAAGTLVINGHTYDFAVPAGVSSGTITVNVSAGDATHGNIETAVVTVKGKGTPKGAGDECVAYEGTKYLDQGVVTNVATSGWFVESAAQHEQQGAWDQPKPSVAGGKIVLDEDDDGNASHVFTPTEPADAGQGAVVEIGMSFDTAQDNPTNDYSAAQAAVRVVTVGEDDYRFAVMVGGAWATNADVVAKLNTDYSLKMAFDYRTCPATVAYSVKTNGGEYASLAVDAPIAGNRRKVSRVVFDGCGKLAEMTGTIKTDLIDDSLVEDAQHNHYADPDAVPAALRGDLTLLWNTAWTPNPNVAGLWTIRETDLYKLDVSTTTPGVRVGKDGAAWTVESGYWEVKNVTGGAETNYMYFADAIGADDANVTNLFLLRGVTNGVALNKSLSLNFNGFAFASASVALGAYDLALAGASPAAVAFDALSGTGALADDAAAAVLLKDVGGFAGSLDVATAAGGIAIGPNVTTATTGKITLAADGSATIAAGKSWTAASGIQVDGTLGGAGTLASVAAFGNGATLASADLATTAVPAFGNALTVTVAGAKTGTPVLAVPAMSNPEVAVTVNGVSGYALIYKSGALQLYKPAPMVFTVTGITTTPSTNFNGSAVEVAYSDYQPGSYEDVTVELSVNGHVYAYAGALAPGAGTVRFDVPAGDLPAGLSRQAVVTVKGTDPADPTDVVTAFEGAQYAYQGHVTNLAESAWFSASATGTQLNETGGAWTQPNPEAADGVISFPEDATTGAPVEYTFEAGPAQQGQVAVVEAVTVFDAALDTCPVDLFDVQAAFRVVTVGDAYRFAALVDGAWVTNTALAADVAAEYTVRTVLDYRGYPSRVRYEVKTGSGAYELVTNGAVRIASTNLASVSYAGNGTLRQMTGRDCSALVDPSLVEDGEDNKYASVDQAFASGKGGLKLLWDASWDPSAMRAGTWTVSANGYKLYTSTEGVKLDFDGASYSVTGDYFEAMTFWISDNAVHTNRYTYLTNALVKSPSSATNLMLRSVALPAGSGNEFALDKSVVLMGDTNVLTGAGFAVADNTTLTIASGYIGVGALVTNETAEGGVVRLEGGKYTAEKATAWAGSVAEGYHMAQLAIADGDYVRQVIVGAEPKADEIVLPVSEDGGTTKAGSLALTEQQLIAAKVIGGGETSQQIVDKLNAKASNGNRVWENVVLGLKNDDKTSVPVVTPVQSTNPDAVTLKPTGIKVDEASGATVTYRVHMADTPGGKSASPVVAGSYENEVEMPLPASGVKYYTIEVVTTPAR